MRTTVVVTLFIVVIIALEVPPLLTRGACDAEFERARQGFHEARSALLTPGSAQAFLNAQRLSFVVLSHDRCEAGRPRDVDLCPDGPLIWGLVPVHNRICRFYRDDSIRFQLAFNERAQLVRIQTDMRPVQLLRIPYLGDVGFAR
ncbi:MAG: hypothetical protein JSS29_10720 [Proteobacteria bacterium]|nr:hypothetical protein [Pseudomonadota bacterium]